ncbi:MAG: oligosaccharide flippase family protein [Bacteroidota bacterium]
MKPLLRNALSAAGGDAGSRLVGFFISVYLARTLSPSGFGMIGIGLAILGYQVLLASPGILLVETRNVAAGPGVDHRRVGGVLALRLSLSLLLWLATWAFAWTVFGGSSWADITVLYACSLLPLAFLLDWFFQGKEDFARVALSRLVSSCVYALVLVLAVRSPGDLYAVPLAFCAGNAASAAYLFLSYRRRYGSPGFEWEPGRWGTILKENLPAGLASLLGHSVMNLPPIVIGLALGTAEAGLFGAAMKIVFSALVADRLLNALLLPALTRQYPLGGEHLSRLVETALKALALVLLPALLAGIWCAEPVMELVFGSAYVQAASVLAVLAGYVGCTVLNSVLVSTLVAGGKEALFSRIMMVSAGLQALLLVPLTAASGITGAAWAVVAGEAVAFVLLARAVEMSMPISITRVLARPLLAGIPMMLWLVFSRDMPPFLSVPVSVVLFGVAATAFGVFRREEMRYLKEKLV